MALGVRTHFAKQNHYSTFDMVPHGRLLLKLKEYGIDVNVFQSMEASLNYQMSLVVFPKVPSLAHFCSLFTYVNDLPSCVSIVVC